VSNTEKGKRVGLGSDQFQARTAKGGEMHFHESRKDQLGSLWQVRHKGEGGVTGVVGGGRGIVREGCENSRLGEYIRGEQGQRRCPKCLGKGGYLKKGGEDVCGHHTMNCRTPAVGRGNWNRLYSAGTIYGCCN